MKDFEVQDPILNSPRTGVCGYCGYAAGQEEEGSHLKY